MTSPHTSHKQKKTQKTHETDTARAASFTALLYSWRLQRLYLQRFSLVDVDIVFVREQLEAQEQASAEAWLALEAELEAVRGSAGVEPQGGKTTS